MAKIGSIIEKQRNEGVNSKHAQAKKEKQEAAKAQAATHKSTITKLEVPKLETAATEEPNIFQRALDTLTSAAKGTASQGTELGGLALTGLANLNKKKSAAADAYYQARESADRYLDLMNNAQTDKERNEWKSLAERYIKQAEYFKGEIENATEFKTVQSGANKVYETADKLGDSAAADLERAKQGLGTGGKLAVDFASTAAQWAGDAALGAVTGTGMLPMMLRAAGGGAQQARANGADAGQQAVYALGSGVLAGATERIANVASPLKKVFGKGILDDAIQKAAGKMTQNAAGRMALSFISEGGEEMLESAVQPILQNITYDAGAEYDSEWLADTLYQGLMGGLLGGVLGGAGEIGTAAQTRKTQKTTGAQMNALGDDMVRAIIDSGLETDQKSKSYKLAQAADKKVKAGKKLSDKELGALFLETDREYQAQTEKEQKPAEDAEPEESGIVLPTDTQEEEGIVLPTAKAETGSGVVLPETAARNTRNSEMNTQDAAVKGLEQTAALYGVDERTTARVRRISDAVKRNVEFYRDEDPAQNGYYDRSTGTIYVNVNSKNPVAQIIGHELTHSIEEAGEYGKLQELVFDELERKGNDLEQLRQKKKELYARHGVELGDQTVIDSEIVAEYMEKNLLTNEESIRELVRKDRTLAEKIMDQIDKILAALGNEDAQARVFLSKAKRIYSAALNETTQKSQETQKPQAEQETEEAQQEPEGKRKSRKQQKEEEERRQKERRAERVEEKVRGTTMDKEELAAAYAAGEITEEEFDRAMESIISDENEIGEDLLKGPEKYSFGGENARRADLDALRQAKEMERQGVAMQTIFRETGWFTGADGKWRFEIDDSGARYDPRNQEGAVPGQTLADFLQHDELFKNYPQLRKTQVRFEDLGRGLLGSYSRSTDTITLNESLRDAPEDVLVHEIQHAVQMAEGFAQGANEKFWSRQIESGYDSRTEAQRREAKRLWNEFYKIRDEEPEFFSDMMDLAAIEPTVPRGEINWETLEQIEEDPPEWKRYDQMRDSLEEKYGDTRVWDFQDLRYKIKQAELNNGRTAAELYYDTAGEIEARDVESRRKLSAEERRNRMPDTGNEDTVFVETELGDSSYSISEDSAGKELTQQQKLTSNTAPTEDPDIRFSIGYDSDWRTLSEDQKRYFENSVVRDESGRLMVLYHGSTSPLFTEFNTENGVWMTPEESYARAYADVYDSPYTDTAALTGMESDIYMPLQRQRMYEVYADLRNVVELGEINGTLNEGKLGEIAAAAGIDAGELLDIAEPYMGGSVFEMTRSKDFLDLMRNAGFDGMYAEEDGVPAFCAIGSPEQVKLTSNKNPSQNPDIRYSVEETPEQENDRRTAVDTEQTGAYDGNRMTAARGGLYNGPGAQRNDGDALSEQVRRPETVDTGVRGRGIQTNGRIQEEQGQRAGVPRWARGRLIDGTDRQGGFDDGQDEYELRGVHGEDVWRRKADGTDTGRAGRSGPSDARGGAADERRRSAAPAAWARGRIIDKPSADAGIAAENAARYGANVFVVEDAAIKEQNPTAWALTSGGNIYISDKIPAELADVVGFHEAVHAAKQRRDTQYLNLLEDTGKHIDFGSNQAQKVLGVILKRRFSGKDLADISQDQMNTIFDELNALVWGFHKADPENARAQFAGMFRDYESYISELDAAMESNQDSAWRDPGMLPTAETGQNENAGPDIRYSVEDQETDAQEQEAQAQETQEPAADVVSMLPKKAQGYLAAAERKMVNAIGNAMNVPYRARRDFLQTITREISMEYLTDGKISEDTMNNLFERAYEEGRVVDEEFYTQYKDLKDYLRTVPVTISQEDAADIADYNDFRKSTFGRLRIVNEGGTPVDVVYEELRNMARELFPGNLTHPADQLMRMFDVAKSIQRSEKNLDEFYGENAGEFKRWAKNEFETAVSNTLSSLRNVKRYAEDQARESSFEPTNLTQEQVMELYKDLKKRRKDQEKAQAKNLLTKKDEVRVNELMRGMISLESINPEEHNVAGIKAVYEAKQAYEEVAKKLRDWNAERRGILNDQADKILETANSWKDKRAGILYSRETMIRNIQDIVPDENLADEIIKTYFTPVQKANSEANRLKNRMRDEVRKMGLSRKVAEGNTVSEAHAVQLIGEAQDNIQVLENSRGRTKTRDGKMLEDWKAVVSDLWEENPNLDKRKIENAVGEFRKIYDELFQQMNEARVRNGYEPINYRRGYFPHFQPGNTDGILDAFGRALGISTEVTALPTTINGLTHTFKPGIRYMGNALERLGFNTAYDAVEGFDRYIEGAADVIYQTDNIQRLRALARQTRYRTGDEGIRKQVDAVLADPRLTETEKTDKIDKIYETARFALSNFVVELDEYTNLLANKKSRYDRSMEADTGRRIYNIMKTLENRVAANMVAVNPASWLTNFIPLTQGGGVVGYRELLPAMWDTLKSYKENDGFVDRSTFLTNRRGSDPLVRSWSQNMSAVASAPMTWIDSFVADSLVRARYSQNLKNGLSEQASMDEADQFVARLMADRSKGSMPTLFQRNNPLTKLFTQFQLEVNNQVSFFAKDMPREYKNKGMEVLAAALLRIALGGFIFNELFNFFIGRRPALDPIGILNDTAGDLTGYELPNLVELGTGVLTGDAPDFQTERVNGYEAVANLTGNILESTPFVGSLLGGGRLPISNALPDAANLSKGLFNGEMPMKKRISTVAKELGNPLTYVALPFGGGQLKKVFQGVKAVVQGGRYSLDSEGNQILQYPVYNDSVTDVAGNLLTGTLFGVTATEGGKEWIENEFKSLNAAQTETYLAMQELGVDGRTAFDLITSIRDAEKTETTSKAQEQRKVLMNADAPGIAKGAAYYGLMASDSEKVLMDVLDDTGADLGEVASVFVKMKDADLLSGAAVSNAKRDALKNSALTDDEKIVIYKTKISDTRDEDISEFQKAGIPFDTFLEAQNEYSTINEEYNGASKKAVEFSRWVNQQNLTDDQAAVLREAFPLSGGSYDKLVGSGLDDEAAYQVSSALEELEPEDGEDSVSKIQQYKAVTESGLSEEEQVQALSAVMTETEYERLLIGYDAGVTPESYVRFKEMLPGYDADGNGRYRKEEVEAAVRAIPGLSNAQRAALWQIQNKSWKPTGNPFSTSTGRKVYNDLQGAASMLPTETETGGGIMLPMG